MPRLCWERTVSRETLEKFKADYADHTIKTSVIGSSLHLDPSTVSGVARRLGLPPRRNTSTLNILSQLLTEEKQLKQRLAEVKELKAQASVTVTLHLDVVEIGGLLLDGEVLGTDLDQLRLFVQGGGLAKIRDLIGRNV